MITDSVQIQFFSEPLAYTGKELRSHFLLDHFKMVGSSIAIFSGPCDVKIEDLVDLEDQKNEDPIYSQKMVHLMGEFFEMPLRQAVLLQRMMMVVIAETLGQQTDQQVTRRGDDLYIQDRKFSVSIATCSPVSSLIHVGLNVDATNAPVAAIGLNDLGIEVTELVTHLSENLKEEFRGIDWACVKVRPVI